MVDIIFNIKKVCKRKLIFPLIITVIMPAILFLCPFYNIFHPDVIDNISDVDAGHKYVSVHADRLYYTGYNLNKSFGREYGYYYSIDEDKCIFAIVPVSDTPAKILKDYDFKAKVIKRNRPFKKMLSAFANDLNWNINDLSGFSEDFVVSSPDYSPKIYMAIMWITLFILFVSIKKVISEIMGIFVPYFYPVCTFLGKKEQKALIDNAQSELLSENYLQINSMYITENYFIDIDKSYVSIIPLKDIIWCYRVGELRLNPNSTSPDYSLCFAIKSGAVIADRHKTSDEALELLNAIRATEYDIIIGHSESKQKEAKERLKVLRNN